MNIIRTGLNFLMMSIEAVIENYDFDSAKTYWEVEPPFIKIKSDCHESVSKDYIIPTKKSTRGRKKKVVSDTPKKFKSNISLVIRKFVHRPAGKKDNFTKTAVKCIFHDNCEVIAKEYNIRIFNKGKIVCVGVLNENKSDFIECVEEVKKFIIKRKIESYKKYEFPEQIYEAMNTVLQQKYVIKNISSTLENYQFSINYNIDLYKLKDFFIQSGNQIINIDYNRLYKFFADTIMAETFDFDSEKLISMLDRGSTKARKNIVSRRGLQDILGFMNLRLINLNFAVYWNKFTKNHDVVTTDNIKYSFLKQFIIHYFAPFRKKLDILEYSLVESVIFKEQKNTLMVKKKKDNSILNIRIFGTGIINIQGGNSRVTSTKAYEDLIRIFEEIKDKILYIPDNPPLISFQDILDEFCTYQKSDK